MKKRGHYCKVCGEYKANEKFSGKDFQPQFQNKQHRSHFSASFRQSR